MTDSLQTTSPKIAQTISSRGSGTLFAGVNAAVCQTLGISSLCHRSALLDLGKRRSLHLGAVEAVFATLSDNLRSAQRLESGAQSRENWRWCRPQPQIASHNSSPEVRLERAIASACVRAGRQDWANQVPVASGIAGSSADRRRAIDLVHQRDASHFQLIELKIASDTPLYAAIEIVGYGCAWLLAREDSALERNALIDARKLDLIVLAPREYYEPYSLCKLEKILSLELMELGSRVGVALSFQFQQLPQQLSSVEAPAGDALLALMDQRRGL